MKPMLCVSALVALSWPALGMPESEGQSCRVFVLKRVDDGFAIETVELAQNETKVFFANAETRIIDIILPVGRGGSGSLVRWSDEFKLTARCADGALKVSSIAPNDRQWARPARKLTDLARYDVRVSVSAADGTGQNFLIIQNRDVVVDEVGPVVDLFAGKVPMSQGDHTLYTETYLHSLGDSAVGEATLRYDRWPMVVGKLPDGSEGTFIVDIGAGTSVISRAFLPEGTKIEKAAMTQYAAGKKKMLKYAPGGATGKVETILGYATLPALRFDALRFESPVVDVIKELPDFFGEPIVGIVGLDLLRRCSVLSLCLAPDGTSSKMRMAASSTKPSESAVEIPFTIVNSHLAVDGAVNGHRVHFILDTGAPDVFLDAAAASRLGVETDESRARPGRGLDGGSTKTVPAKAVSLKLGDRTFDSVRPVVSSLSCFARLRTNGQNAGLLGNSFFSRFKQVEIDFDKRFVRFVD